MLDVENISQFCFRPFEKIHVRVDRFRTITSNTCRRARNVDDWNSRTIRYQIRSTKDEKRSYEELGCLESSDNPWNGQSLEKERERERKENVNSTSIRDFNWMKNFLSVRWQWKRLFSRRKIDIIAIDERHSCQERCIEHACLLRYYWKTPTKLSI